ncbi:MAG: DUF4157 domain-containing protein [Aulosira sp. ZfuVER01]|nr:DUF4157 domain-containing protein [Aulosira sp. ZfuVER01]MDZ8000830.1 DUF4157 domain-containing protein [Aulosira sp. DedVER01a]MDZ8055899.1 DUF4157 domain-containing protein [Aulosira sp. ZfuCHP01]
MKTNENQKSTNHQPAKQKPFFGGSPEQAFFTTDRAGATPFFQLKTSSSSTLQAKSATDETEELNQSALQRMTAFAFESDINAKGVNTIQRKADTGSEPEEKEVVQRQVEEKEKPVQMKGNSQYSASASSSQGQQPNNTGLPDNLKAGIENLSGIAMDDVKVHYNSAKPPHLQALAYTQGTEIHISSGQEKHLAHEAWHVVQQKQGRVQPTTQAQGVGINDDTTLEHEADVMGDRAVSSPGNFSQKSVDFTPVARSVIQMYKCTSYYLIGIFNQNNFSGLINQIGRPAYDYFITLETTDFSPLIDAFLPQNPINNAAAQVAFLSPHAGDDTELRLAIKALQLANYDPGNAAPFYNFFAHYKAIGATELAQAENILTAQGNDIPKANYIYKYTHDAISSKLLAIAQQQLQTHGDDPVAAEQAMKPFNDFFAHYKAIGATALTQAENILTAQGNDISKANYIYKYTAISKRVLAVAQQQLQTHGDDPVAAEQAMVALAPYNYFGSVKTKVDVLATGKARGEIDQEKQAAADEKIDFETRYQQKIEQTIDNNIDRNLAKKKKEQFAELFPNVDTTISNDGTLRDNLNKARNAKIAMMAGREAQIEAQMPNRTATITSNVQNLLKPVYQVSEDDSVPDWCLNQAGQDLKVLKSCVEIVVAVNGNLGLIGKLAPLSIGNIRMLIGKLSIKQQGQLSGTDIVDLVDLLTPLNGTAINALVNILHPSLNSQGIDNLVLNLTPSNGTAIDAFIRQYVPQITPQQLADLVHRLRPLDIANINLLINLLNGLNLGQIYALTVAMTPGGSLIGNEILQFVTTLTSILNPLTAVQIQTLVLALEGLPGDQINTMVNQLIAMGINTGTNISARIQNMRGSLQVGGAKSTDVTTVDGERILSGTQIATRVGQVSAAGGVYAHLSYYPHSNINPTGRNEDLLWQDCDPAIIRHASETAADITVRQQMALNAIVHLGGVNRQIAQQVFQVNNGQQPRQMQNGAGEDNLSALAGNAGHINARHVIGTPGVISTLADLQARANGNLAYPPCPGIASAFASAAASQTGINNAMQAANWPNVRRDIIRGLTHNINVRVAVVGHVARNGHAMNNAPGGVFLQITGANVQGGFYAFQSWPVI